MLRACQLLGIPRASYYERINRKESKHTRFTKKLDEKIFSIFEESGKRYGAPKIHAQLQKDGWKISLKLVQKRMKLLDIRSIIVKKWKAAPSSKHRIESKENLLEQNFSTTGVNQKWVTDITYIHTVKDGWVYLSTIMDLHTRKIIAWDLGKTMETSLVLSTLNKAITVQGTNEGLILHSDLGSQYTSNEYEKTLKNKDIVHSFSKKGCPYDNACIESFHSILKKEEVYQSLYADYDHANIKIFQYIEGFYNRNRIHSAINYLTPVEMEKMCLVS